MDKKAMAEDLKKTLDQACYAYYNTPNKIMSDEEFDQACLTYFKLTGEHYNTQTAAPKQKGNKRLVNTKHSFKNLVGTIDNKFPNIDEFKDWLKSLYKNLGLKHSQNIEILCSLKYDGNSVAKEFKDGKLILALTRGKDGNGADLTDMFKGETISDKRHIGVRNEIMMTYEMFDKLNKIKADNNDDSYVNPRSTVAGILSNTEDGYKYKDFLVSVPLSIRVMEDDDKTEKVLTRYEELELIDELKLNKEIEYTGEIYDEDFEGIINGVKELYDKYTTERENLDYMIDGIVVELMDNDYKNKLGTFDNGSPKWACALKFPYQEKASVITDFVFEASPNGSGKITPSVLYEPVKFNGATQTKTSLANYKRFTELKLGIGSKVLIQYRNDVLSYVEKLDCPENEKITPYPFTDKCPICGSKVVINDEKTFAFCSYPRCKMKIIGKINNYTNCVGIKGIEISTLEKLYEAGLIQNSTDLYKLRYRDISRIKGLGELSAENIIDAIKTNVPNDYQLLAGLGIANLGETLSKVVLSEYSFDQLADINVVKSEEFKERIMNLEGFSNIMTERLISGLTENNIILNELLANVKFKTIKRERVENILKFVTTGDPDRRYFKDRDAMKEYIEGKGHKLIGSVSKNTNYLVTEDTTTGTVKNKKAKELGIPIITSAELKDLLG